MINRLPNKIVAILLSHVMLCLIAQAAMANPPAAISWFDGDRPRQLWLDDSSENIGMDRSGDKLHLHDQHSNPYQLGDTLLVHFRTLQSAKAAADWAAGYQLTPIKSIALSNAWLFHCDLGIACVPLSREIYQLPGVRYAYPDFIRPRYTRFYPDDYPLFDDQWHLYNTGQGGGLIGQDVDILSAWNDYTGDGINIAVVDDGLETTHEDLAENIVPDMSWDYVDGDDNPDGGSGHGTSVAGVATARGGNGTGVTGAAPAAGLVGLRLLGADTDTNEADALTRDQADNHIYTNSWGPTDGGASLDGPGPLTQAALQDGVNHGRDGKGSIYVWAGGNGGRLDLDNANYDGYVNSRFTVSVTASTNQGYLAWYSEEGASHLLTAPSSGGTLSITTTKDGGGYTPDFSGTSSAAPLVAGIVALMLEAKPELGWRDVQQILANSADLIDAGGPDWLINAAGYWINHKYGFGQVNATAAVNTAIAWSNVAREVSLGGQRSSDLAIPDDNSVGIHSNMNIIGNIRIESADIIFTSDHAKWGDLEIVLTSPAGTESVLARTHSNGYGDQYAAGWRFNSMRLLGEESAGEWTLTVRDQISDNTGNLQEWLLLLYGSVQSTQGCEADPLEEIPDLTQDTTCVSPSSISAANRISHSAMVQYSAPVVQLTPGFGVESGSEFLVIN